MAIAPVTVFEDEDACLVYLHSQLLASRRGSTVYIRLLSSADTAVYGSEKTSIEQFEEDQLSPRVKCLLNCRSVLQQVLW
jgi:hypothetical protein